MIHLGTNSPPSEVVIEALTGRRIHSGAQLTSRGINSVKEIQLSGHDALLE
jgi:hypothetical protein